MIRLFLIVACVGTSLPATASAQHNARKQVDPAVHEKCRGEVRRLCPFFIPTRARIESCILENQAKFSDECRQLLLTKK